MKDHGWWNSGACSPLLLASSSGLFEQGPVVAGLWSYAFPSSTDIPRFPSPPGACDPSTAPSSILFHPEFTNSPIHQFGHLNLCCPLGAEPVEPPPAGRAELPSFLPPSCSFLPPAKSTRGREQTTVTSVLRNLVCHCIYLGCQYKNGVRILSFARPRACVTGL